MFQVEEQPGDGFVDVAAQPGMVGFHLRMGVPFAPGSVIELDEAHAALKAANIPFDGDVIHYEGMVKLATFFDPDKNALMIAEDLTNS